MVMDTATRVQILDETNCISHSTNTLGKGMNPIILSPSMGKYLQPWWVNESKKKKTLNSKPVKLHLKIDLVSYPARAVNMYHRNRYDVRLCTGSPRVWFKKLTDGNLCSWDSSWSMTAPKQSITFVGQKSTVHLIRNEWSYARVATISIIWQSIIVIMWCR